jgi:hypothetical protein
MRFTSSEFAPGVVFLTVVAIVLILSFPPLPHLQEAPSSSARPSRPCRVWQHQGRVVSLHGHQLFRAFADLSNSGEEVSETAAATRRSGVPPSCTLDRRGWSAAARAGSAHGQDLLGSAHTRTPYATGTDRPSCVPSALTGSMGAGRTVGASRASRSTSIVALESAKNHFFVSRGQGPRPARGILA